MRLCLKKNEDSENHTYTEFDGALPLIFIFAELSALGSLRAGIPSVVKMVNDMR